MAELHFEPHPRRSGAMTQHLRALAPVGEKVLRVAWVRGGRVLDERVLKERGHVTIGESEKNVFVVANSRVSLRLFEQDTDGYVLKLSRDMSARVALVADGSLLDLDGATTDEVRLTGDSRGRVRVGEDTFLFQFVHPPPVQPKPQLPVAVVHGPFEVDIATTTVAALSFLLHFLAVGALYSDWLDPVVNDGVVVSGLLESVQALPIPVESVTDTTPAPTTDLAPTEKNTKQPGHKSPGTGLSGTPTNTSATDAALTDQLDQLELATLAALNVNGAATDGVLKDGEVPTSALDAAAASAQGVSHGRITLRTNGGPLRPGQSADLSALAGRNRSVQTGDSGQQIAVTGPKVAVSTPPPTTQGGVISDATRVVAGMRPGFRGCYNRGLADYPDASGNIQLAIRVGPGGEVQSVSATPSGNLPSSIVSCVRGRAEMGLFSPPVGGSAVVMVPVTLIQLKR